MPRYAAENVADFLLEFLPNLLPKPTDSAAKVLVNNFKEQFAALLAEPRLKRELLETARQAELNFRIEAPKQLMNADLVEALVSFPVYNRELFQNALAKLPEHLDEEYLAKDLQGLIADDWKGKFTPTELREGVAIYLNCLRVQLLKVDGFAEIITQLAILRIDQRTQTIDEKIDKLVDEKQSQKESGTAPALHQLPRFPDDFVGREQELTTILASVETNKGTAIRGLVGMGGIGKTTLGLVAAHRLSERYPDAQIFIDMRGGSQDALAAEDVMRHVILSFYPTARLRKSTQSELAARYRSTLSTKKAILFLDNVLDSSQVASLLPPRNCFLLVTSRHHLTLPGLQSVPLDVLKETNAIQLLMENCPQITETHASQIAALCGHLPLALRLAASYLQIHTDRTAEEYITQLSDQAKRLRALHVEGVDLSIEVTFEQSYQQLSKDEQRYWSMLAIFPPSFRREAIAAVWNLDGEVARDLLGKLLQYSLLEYDQAADRYHLHDLFRDFAYTKLTEDDKAYSFLNYLRHYQNVWKMAEELYAKGGDNITRGLQLFDAEFIHLSNAYVWALQNANTNPAVSTILAKIPDSLNLIHLRLPPKQRLEWFRAAFVAAEKLEDLPSQNLLLGNIGSTFDDLAEFQEAIPYYERAIEIAKRLGDQEKLGFWLGDMGAAYSNLGQIPRALEYLEQALTIARISGNKRHECDCLNNIGMAYSVLGEIRKAIDYLSQALEITREIGNREKEGVWLGNIGAGHISLGEYSKALEYLDQALTIARELGDKPHEDFWLGTIGIAYMNLGEFEKAIDFFENALKIVDEDGNRLHQHNWMGNLGQIHLELGDHHKALGYLEPALQIARDIGDRQSEGEWLGNIGVSYAIRGENQEAKELLEQALTIALEVGAQWQMVQWQSQLGELYVKTDEYEKARENLESALRVAKELGIRVLEGSSLFAFAKLFKAQHNQELALQYAQEARIIFESLGHPELKKVDEFIESLKE